MTTTLKERLQTDLKEAMRGGDNFRRDTLRLLTAALKQAEVDNRETLNDEQVLNILKKEAKRRQESIDELQKAGRASESEQAELTIIESYLPVQMAREAVADLARAVIAEVGASSAKDMGAVMKVLKERVGGAADGKVLSDVVRELLA